MTVQPVLPVIPEYITVHLGKPDQAAQNVQVPFAEYIKSVASSEIYPTWPDSSLRANIYAIISFALNRIYTEWYRSKGYDFDITNSTQYDQAYQYQREIFENISNIVDDLFNDYVIKQGSVEPYFTQFCNGTTTKCKGLSQWGTVDLANEGYVPYDILTHYYGDDINLVKNAPVQNIESSYPGIPIRPGQSGNDVLKIQNQLNRIHKNFPSVTQIPKPDSVFGADTEKSVKSFQKTFNLTQDGIVGKATWYKIKEIYNGVKKLSELTSEGIKLEEVTPAFSNEIAKGSYGVEAQTVQYYLAVIGYFNEAIPIIPVDGYFGDTTEAAVKAFQSMYGLPVTGVVNADTWNKMTEVYSGIVFSLPESFYQGRASLYPGVVLKTGMESEDVRKIQVYLNTIRTVYPSIPAVPATGFFGDQTYNAVIAFQKIFGIAPTGLVGPGTWNKLAIEYDTYKGLR